MSQFYEEWRKTASFSNRGEDDKRISENPITRALAASLTQKVRNQFILDKSQADAPANKYLASQDYQTSNIVAQEFTKLSQNSLKTLTQTDNSALKELPAHVFEVPAKKCSSIWNTQQYKDGNFRDNLNTTTNRMNIVPHDADLVDRLRETQFNNQKTNIGEYANALNRGRVFINPKFSSC